MELVVFDLDGTLLNKESAISGYTSETLKLLTERGIAYTVATGRALHGARSLLDGHRFTLPQAYKNGVVIWHPQSEHYSRGPTLTPNELHNVVTACQAQGLTPFVFSLDKNNKSSVYHPPIRSSIERELVRSIDHSEPVTVYDLDELPADATITHVNAIGDGDAINRVLQSVENEPHLIGYSGVALEGAQWRWLDIHHGDASKGGAVREMKDLLGIERVICFGDSDNDLSMFGEADESYAPSNANDAIRSAATAVIGHHDEDGIARFLRERFDL